MSIHIYTSEKAAPYVYLVTHRVTGEFYIGYRERNVVLDIPASSDLGHKYFTSSTKVKYRFAEFEATILAEFFGEDAGKAAFEFEQSLIELHIKNPLNLNGYVKNKFYGGGQKSPITREKISTALKGKAKSQDHRKKLGAAVSKSMTEERRKQIGQQSRGRIPGERARSRMSISALGKSKTQEHVDSISKGLKGKVKTKLHCVNLSIALSTQKKKTCPHCGTESIGANANRWHFDNCIHNPILT